MRVLSWFSCGAASAVATKLTPGAIPVYCETGSEHPDNARFAADCERWFGRAIERIRSDRYADTWEVWTKRRYLAGIDGALCTTELKVMPRLAFQRPDDVHVFGYTADGADAKRAGRLRANFPELTIQTPLIERGITKAACLAMVERAGIMLPPTYAMGFQNNNCFGGETQFITDSGTRTLRDAVGEHVRVRGVGGGWKKATVRSFGIQPLLEIILRRGESTRSVYATAGHRWFVKADASGTKRKERTTVELRPGDRLASMFGQLGARVRPSSFGIAQGIVFGDGTRGTTLNTAATLVLCGDKNRELLRYFPLSPTSERPSGIEVRDLPRFWKDVPRLDESQSFLYGWLAGYFAADGNAAEGGRYTISSGRLGHLEFARDVAVRLGIGCHDIRSVERLGYGSEPSKLFTLPLIGATLREDFFLIDEHRKRFLAQTPRQPHPWTVTSVAQSERVEEVFCAVVPDGEAFTLAGNIFTGNCLPCVKATSPDYWALVRERFPEKFDRMARLSRELGVRLCRLNGERAFIDEIPSDQPTTNPVQPSCDFLCQLAELDHPPPPARPDRGAGT